MGKTTAEILQVLNLAPGLLSGKTAIITGAGRGIGLEIARAFAWLGANVVIADISDIGMKCEREISETGGSGKWIFTDVSNEDSVKNLIDECERNFGAVDYLINNAIYITTASVEEIETKVWDQVISVNLRGTFLTCKYTLPGMQRRGTGTIINMVSTDAMPYLSAYMASKGGITSFTQSLAAEVVGKGISVIALAPGFVRTPGMQSISEGLAPHLGMSSDEFLNLSLHPAYAGWSSLQGVSFLYKTKKGKRMNKKVLVISASPRKGGNSDLLCDQFVQGARDGGNQAEKIFLRDRKVNPCTACEACLNSGVCVQKNDMAEILEKMVSADVIVMATPVYFYTMNAQMKMVIDRTVPRYTEVKNKDFYYIATAADTDQNALERTIDGFRAFTDCLGGANERGVIYGTGVWKKGEINEKPLMQQAYKMGNQI